MAKLSVRRLGTAAAIALALGLVFLILRPEPVRIDVARVERGPMRVTVDEEGRTRVRDRFTIAAPIAGRVARIALDAGDAVQRGAVVARMHPLPLDPRTHTEDLRGPSARLRASTREWRSGPS